METRYSCAILDDYQGAAEKFADWSSLPVTLRVLREHLGEEALVEAIQDCEIVVIMRERTPFSAKLLAHLPHLRLLVTSGMRNAAIDLGAARAAGIRVSGTASSPAPPGELTWALILGLARHLVPENQQLRAGGSWQHTVGTELAGKRLGVLGLGKIGSRVAKVGLAFGMEVVAWSPNLSPDRAEREGVKWVTKEELLETSDVLTVHLVLGERSRGILGEKELRSMKATALLVNTARAAIVEQAALQKALEEGWIAGAGLDVFEEEPLPAEHPFRRLPNVLATPHLGYVSDANYRGYFQEAVEDIRAFLDGRVIREL